MWGYWGAARLPPSCRTADGALLEVIYRGQWSYGYGPDYKAAVLCFAHGPTVRGDVELHARSSDWRNHAHDGNPMYDDVILHVVWIDDEPCLARGRVLELSAWRRPATFRREPRRASSTTASATSSAHRSPLVRQRRLSAVRATIGTRRASRPWRATLRRRS
ncbi:MAG: DUF2851 family protein [Chloroflexia bacterium]